MSSGIMYQKRGVSFQISLKSKLENLSKQVFIHCTLYYIKATAIKLAPPPKVTLYTSLPPLSTSLYSSWRSSNHPSPHHCSHQIQIGELMIWNMLHSIPAHMAVVHWCSPWTNAGDGGWSKYTWLYCWAVGLYIQMWSLGIYIYILEGSHCILRC